MRKLNTIGVDAFLERRKSRLHVGTVYRKDGAFVFTYDKHYFKAKNVIPLGPEFPLTQQQFTSPSFFPSLRDRIPSTQNPAYPEYCLMLGIDPKEQDPLILLSTIGRRGPSSFVFAPIFDRTISAEEVVSYRRALGLTTREFAQVFELSLSSLHSVEHDRNPGPEILRRLDIILNFPAVALDYLLVNQGHLMHEKWVHATRVLSPLSPTKEPK